MAGIILPRWLTHPEPMPPVSDDPAPETFSHVTGEKVAAFLHDIVATCRRHGLWISHEDEHGAFIITEQSTETWIREARAE